MYHSYILCTTPTIPAYVYFTVILKINEVCFKIKKKLTFLFNLCKRYIICHQREQKVNVWEIYAVNKSHSTTCITQLKLHVNLLSETIGGGLQPMPVWIYISVFCIFYWIFNEYKFWLGSFELMLKDTTHL